MPNVKEPIELLKFKGKKHLTKEEIQEREESEVKAPANAVKPPGYLTREQKREFNRIAKILLEIGIMSDLDCDALARYLQSQDKYLQYDQYVNRILEELSDGDLETMQDVCAMLDKYENLRDKTLKQCRTAASDLGLTISSRCKLVVPKPPEAPKSNKFGRFAT